MVDNSAALVEKIAQLKKEKDAVILAHYYTRPEVQAVADFLGDSLALSVKAKEIDAKIILFAGVHFMAETAKVLSPDKKILLPCPEAGCSLAESCEAEALARLKAQYPNHKVVSYVNTSVGVKALTDVCCTSSNALQVVESIPSEQPIIFAPDSIYDTVGTLSGWQGLSAIENGAYYKTPYGPYGWLSSPPAVQRYLGMLWLGALLYPDYVQYDLQEEITEYYHLFYGCDLTDTMYHELTANALAE